MTNNRQFYSFSLVIRGVAVDPDAVSEGLTLAPTKTWRKGDPVRNREGNATAAGQWWDSGWEYREEHAGEREFFGQVATCLEELNADAGIALLHDLAAAGARITMIVRLSGESNIGDVLPSPSLAVMGRLGIDLSIEVFREYAPSEPRGVSKKH